MPRRLSDLLLPRRSRRNSTWSVPLLLLTVVAGLAWTHAAGAQSTAAGATLHGWKEEVRLALLDQRHAYGGLYYDRGAMRRLTPDMDHEYGLDITTAGFTLADDAAWYRSASGFRSYAGSIDKSRFATKSHFRQRVDLANRHTFLLEGIQQEDLRVQRAWVEIGYAYRIAPGHQIGVSQTAGSYKPDLDLTLSYAMGGRERGRLLVELTSLDVFNDLIFETIGADPALEDTVRRYQSPPLLVALEVETPRLRGAWRGLRGEMMLGWQPEVEARVASQRSESDPFRWRSAFRYAGMLAEYQYGPVTAGASYRHIYSLAGRAPDSVERSASGYVSEQAQHALTLYLLGAWRAWKTELWAARAFHRDEQSGTNFEQARLPAAFRFDERTWALRARASRIPLDSGFRYGVGFALQDRSYDGFDALAPLLRFENEQMQAPRNSRFTLRAGYQFRPGAHLIFGANLDLDGDSFYSDRGLTRYDGAFGRLTLTW